MKSLLLLLALAAAGPNVEVRMTAGEAVAGALVRLGEQEVVVETPEGEKPLALQSILSLTLPEVKATSPASPVWVKLVDGSELAVLDFTAEAGHARLVLGQDAELKVPIRDVWAVRLKPAVAPLDAQWKRMLDMADQSDLLVVTKETAMNYYRGVLGDVTAEAVRFQTGGEPISVSRGKVFGLVYRHAAGRTLPEPVARLVQPDGSAWQVVSVQWAEGRFAWQTVCGLTFAAPADRVQQIDFSQNKLVWLSDLEPELAEWSGFFGPGTAVSALGRWFAPRRDQGLMHEKMLLDGQSYHKGLALHSRTLLVYRLPGAFRRFEAIAGIDDRVRPRGHVRLEFRGDDRVLLDTTVAGTEPAKPIVLDLTNVRRLTILVDFGNDRDVSDHVNLVEARILK